MNAHSRKTISFDLDTHKLKEIYTKETGKAYNFAYEELRAFFISNGFYHRQGSVYFSEKRCTNADIYNIIERLYEEKP